MERIMVRGLELFAYHGCNPEERRDGQMFLLDLELRFHAIAACRSDDLADTVNYAKALKAAAAAFLNPPCNLIEHAAWRTAQAVLAQFPQVEQITVRVHKPDAPIQLPAEDILFEITCDRGERS
ncbi:MAG: dihydroneopterin aldolase [Oscillospiraceae bacterium]|jgi:dihydroneopterin aldolase|nr:dihydroneopterin aldolase [Oscillospiraceae bacterium]